MFSLKHTRHYWTPYASPTTVKSATDATGIQSIVYVEKCYCGKMRTVTVEADKAPIVRESEDR
jgi:hypothetical protein